jgi:hypothetical protein
VANDLEETKGNMSNEEELEVIIAKWFDGLEWGNEEPEQLDLFRKRRGPTELSPRESQINFGGKR